MGCNLCGLLWDQLMLSCWVSVSCSNIFKCFWGTELYQEEESLIVCSEHWSLCRWVLLQRNLCVPSVLCPGHVPGWSNCLSATSGGKFLSVPGKDRCPHPQDSAPDRWVTENHLFICSSWVTGAPMKGVTEPPRPRIGWRLVCWSGWYVEMFFFKTVSS